MDTLALNVCYADKQFQPIKQELAQDLQNELNVLQNEARENEAPLVTRWAFKGIHLFMQEKGSRGQWRWILRSPLLSLANSRGRLSCIIAQVRLSSEYLWKWNHNPAKGISDVLVFLTDIFGADIAFQPGEVHIALDFTGWDIGSCQVKEHFIHRAVQTAPVPQTVDPTLIAGPEQVIERWKRITGLPFGKHTSAVSCLIYDETHEIKYHSK